MADPPFGPTAGIVRNDRSHQFVRVQTALHQNSSLRLPDQGHRLRGGTMTVTVRGDCARIQ